MNSFARAVLEKWSSPDNLKMLKKRLDELFPASGLNFDDSVTHFARRLTEELYMSDPISSVDFQVKCFNLEFLEDRAKFIESTLKQSVPMYTLSDGGPGSRYKQNLESWKLNAPSGQIMRDDTQSRCKSAYNDLGCGPAVIAVCDQSDLNTSYHVEAFNTPWMQAMNRNVAYNDAGFGNCTPESDARLLSRSVFRNHNKIPQYEQRLQRRALDRCVDETLHNDGERNCMQHGFDMSSINRRLDYIQGRNFRIPEPKMQLNADKYWL